jgi:hypothetical protein
MSVPTSLQPFDLDALLKDRKWYIAKDAAKSLVDDRDLTRYCDKLPPASLEQACKKLRDRRYETNPEADLKVFPGTWRIVNVSYKLSESTAAGQIFQLLRLGFITTLKELGAGYNSSVEPDDEVRVVKATVYPQSNVLELIRRWPYVDPTKADEIIVQLKARKTVDNPTADSQVYAGTFTVQNAYSEKQDDGSCDIVETLSLDLYADWNYTYAKNCKEDIKLVSKEGLTEDELTTALLEYQRTPGTYAAGVWNNVNISFDKTKNIFFHRFVIRWRSSFGPSTFLIFDFDPFLSRGDQAPPTDWTSKIIERLQNIRVPDGFLGLQCAEFGTKCGM